MERLTRASLEHPRLTLLALAAISILLGVGLRGVRSEYGYEVLIGHDHPAVQQLERPVALSGGGAAIKVAWECGTGWPCAHPLDARSLEMAHAVSETVGQRSQVQRVHSPSNATLVLPDAAGFTVRRLVEQVEHGSVSSDHAALVQRAGDTGPALVMTSLALALGFLTLRS